MQKDTKHSKITQTEIRGNLLRRPKGAVFVLALVAFLEGNALANDPSVFDAYNLKYGVSINVPRHWTVLEKQLTDAINTDVEVLTGSGQANNDIILAANYYSADSRDAAATISVSVQSKKTASQKEVAAMTQADLDAMAAQAQAVARAGAERAGDKLSHSTPFRMTKDVIGGYIALRTEYQDIDPNQTQNVSVYVICLGNNLTKITISYAATQKSLLEPTTTAIMKSIRIKR